MQAQHILHSSESNEWYTPPLYPETARTLFHGTIDLDPASCAYANKQSVRPERFYTQEENGLMQDWTCQSMWLNPPYGKSARGRSNQETWSHKLIYEYEAGHIGEAILLVNAATGDKWFAPLRRYCVCFVDGRIHFFNELGKSSQPTHSSVLVYLGPEEKHELFATLFSLPLGWVVLPQKGTSFHRSFAVKQELW